MSSPVKNANLPLEAEKIVIGEKYGNFLSSPLISAGIEPLLVPDNPFVDKRLSGHADLSVFHAGGENVLLAPYLRGSDFADSLQSNGMSVRYAAITQAPNYPSDAQLNAVMVGNRLIYNKKATTDEIICALNKQQDQDQELIHVNQGYVNCSVCIVDRNSIITADRGIAEKCTLCGMDVLMIKPGYFLLDGFDYGFIGGCAFKLSSRILAFTGHIDMHPDKERILDFLDLHSVAPVYLTSFPAFDIGGAIPITEKN